MIVTTDQHGRRLLEGRYVDPPRWRRWVRHVAWMAIIAISCYSSYRLGLRDGKRACQDAEERRQFALRIADVALTVADVQRIGALIALVRCRDQFPRPIGFPEER